MRVSQALSTILTIFLTVAPAAAADVYVSSSNTLGQDVNAQIVTMLGQEISALRRVPTDRLSELAAAKPNFVKRGWLFGRRNGDPVDNFRYSENALALMPRAHGGPEWQCLSEALYFEARGESVKGQFAVAEVILNRTESSAFPTSVCRVVHQGTERGINNCQFSYNCDGRAETISEPQAYEQAGKIARLMLDGEPRILTKGATYYHTTAVRPSWSRSFEQTAEIGEHIFYRDNREYSSN